MNLEERIERELAPEGYAEVSCDIWELYTIGIDLMHSDVYGYEARDKVDVAIESKDALTDGVASFEITVKKDGKVIYEDEVFRSECTATSAWLFNKEEK